MIIERTATGYRGRINGASFTVTIANGQRVVEGKPGHYLNDGECQQILREVGKREGSPLLHLERDTKKIDSKQ